jgi:hypothetical protein
MCMSFDTFVSLGSTLRSLMLGYNSDIYLDLIYNTKLFSLTYIVSPTSLQCLTISATLHPILTNTWQCQHFCSLFFFFFFFAVLWFEPMADAW